LEKAYIFIGGWKENSLVDVLESVSFTLWTSYCNFNCPWCSNYGLAKGLEKRRVSIAEILEALRRNSDFIDYFHVTGGEPTLQHKPLKLMFKHVKETLGLKNSLDTNGSNPSILKDLIEYLDHVAIDVKAPLSQPVKYAKATGLPLKLVEYFLPRIRESIEISAARSLFLELRTTMVPGIVDALDVVRIAEELKSVITNSRARVVFVVQQFIPYETIFSRDFRLKPRTEPRIVRETARKISEVLPAEIYYRTLEDGTEKVR